MRVKVHEIPQEGLTLSEPFDPKGMNLQTAQISFAAPLSVSAFFKKELDTVLVRAEVQGRAQCVCGRCLEVVDRPFDAHFDLGYSVKGMLELDVTDDLRQEILLSFPVKFLCKEDCRGLCPRCGANLNLGPCTCQ